MTRGERMWKWVGLGLCLLSAALVIAIGVALYKGYTNTGAQPPRMGKPILECADASWVDNRAAGACYDHGGLRE